jgi:hypothetical protein
MIAGTPEGAPAMNATGTITMTMREVDRLKVIDLKPGEVASLRSQQACSDEADARDRQPPRSVVVVTLECRLMRDAVRPGGADVKEIYSFVP